MPDLYPGWVPVLQAIPPRTRLYHLAPVGVGTEHVETLTSYVTRLAAAHMVSVYKLIGHEIGPGAAKTELRFQSTTRTRRRFVPLANRQSYLFNASGGAAQNWVAQLCHLTGEPNLRLLTALCWNQAVSGEELVRWNHAWCPQCYQGWQDSGEVLREPLLWLLRPVSLCALHHRPLETRCWKCGRTPHVLTGRSRSGRCGHCQVWLGSNQPKLPGNGEAAPQQTYDFWAAREIGQFLRIAPSASDTLKAEILRANLHTCSEHLFRKGRRGRSFAAIVGASALQVGRWFNKGFLVKLPRLLRISYRLGIPMLDLLSSPPEAFRPDWSLVEENLRRTAGEASLTNSRRVIAIPDSCGPIPLTVVLQITGYDSLRRLRDRDPALHRELVVKHRESRRVAWKKRLRESRAETLAALEQALVASLSLDCPQLLTKTALALNLEISTALIARFPELCAAIVAKRASWKRRQWAEKAAIAQQSANQEMPPTVESLATSLGCQSRTPIRKRFPSVVAALAARFSERVNKRRAILRSALENALKEEPPPSIHQLAKRLGKSRCNLQKSFPEASCALQVRYHDWKRQTARQARAALESEVARIVLDLHTRGIYPSYGRVRSLLPASMQGAYIVKMVRQNRERLGIPTHHATIQP